MANNNSHWFRGRKFPDGNFWQSPKTLDVANPEVPYLPLESPAATAGAIGGFISNASWPQLANYAIVAGIGFFCASLSSPPATAQPVANVIIAAPQAIDLTPPSFILPSVVGGNVTANAQEYRHGTHAVAVQNAENVKSAVWRVSVTPPVASYAIPPIVNGAAQRDEQVIAAKVFPSAQAAAPTPNPIAAFFATLPQNEFQPQAVIIASQPAAAAVAARVIAPVIGLQQAYSDVLPAAIMPSLVGGKVTANVQEYRHGTHAQATHEAERTKSQLWPSLPTPPAGVSGELPPLISAAPQRFDFTQQSVIIPSARAVDASYANQTIFEEPQVEHRQTAVIFKSATTQPVYGPVPPLTTGGMPQASTYQISGLVVSPLEFGVVTSVGEPPSGGYWDGTQARRDPEDLRKSRRDYGITIDAEKVISSVAQRQVEDRHLDEIQRRDELRAEMRILGMEMENRHIAALNDERQRLLTAEIKRLFEIKTHNEQVIALIIAASI